jgi:FkbM family methyltransferase
MRLSSVLKRSLDHAGLSFALLPLVTHMARRHGRGVQRIFRDHDLWIHQTSFGYFAYHEPYVRLDLRLLDELAQTNFFWGYKPKEGDAIVDIGAGAGEETLTFSRAVGPTGKVVCVEAHPRTYRCLQALIEYNRLKNVVAVHKAVAEPGRSTATIESSTNYLANRIGERNGCAVPVTTLNVLVKELGIGRIHFLKMNIEGAERLAILGMTQALKRTEVACISCHDFLAEKTGDESFRSRHVVREFLRESGLKLVERDDPALPVYVRYQVWGYNEALAAALAVPASTTVFAARPPYA